MQKWRCISCNYVYDPSVGDRPSGIPPGVSFEDLPENWTCPICGMPKEMFEKLEEGNS
jgi:rubredoxin